MTTTITEEAMQALLARIDALERRVQTAEDTEAINKLTRAYGYYLDKALWDEALDLFTDDCSIEISALGVYIGKKQAAVLFKELLGKGPAKSDENGLLWGQLYNHLIVQGIVNIDQDGRNASGRWRCFMQIAEFGKSAVWGEGPYEMRYRKGEDGIWRIRKLHFYRTYHTPFDEGWAKAKSPAGGVRAHLPPDLPPSVAYEPWPAVFVPPFHYANPGSGSRRYAREDSEQV
ncbi:nuclear transport factor 2 family protein [Caenimonas sedimenti]|uniref:Nuclear transport factor 2 family protein n=1 Tax=Caenimonas sedimenti TaxID=2596921 RepID=A0A562ZSJ3_9BURK|nr:nuclear transport factor 2 family protein [Caenimonas sedimenti]TWO71114.1 nuclear transport factor 2 family protein [Caenimonas sedimenti]